MQIVKALSGQGETVSRPKILVLASGSFSIPAGKSKTLSLRLTAKARALLARVHTLKTRVTILARDSSGATRPTLVTVTLKLAKKKR